eukprot:scaffold746_cov293-Chaetoceros_neogracile.AAC.30
MKDFNLFRLCTATAWYEVRNYLSSDAAEEEKKSNIMYCNDYGRTCLRAACNQDTPDDIIQAMLDIGGRESIMKMDIYNCTVLHSACRFGRSYNIIKMLIEVGGKDLVMAKSKCGDTALHDLCWNIKKHTKAAEKIKLILQVGDANLLLSTKNFEGRTPLEIATDKGASNLIKMLLTVQSNYNSRRNSNNSSTRIVPTHNGSNSTPIIQSNQNQDATRSSSTNSGLNIPIRGLGIDQNHQSQLREANEKAETIQQAFDQKCIDFSDLEENSQSQLMEAKEQILQIQQDYDQKCADCCDLKEENQVENAEKLELGGTLAMLKKELYQCKRTKVDLENKVEAQGSLLAEQKENGEKDNKYWKDKAGNFKKICSEHKAKLQVMEDAAVAPIAGMQMMKQKEVEAAHAKELEESNRKAADLEAAVETQRLEIADLSSEKDDMEKECTDELKKLTQICSEQKEELQLLKDSTNGEGTKRKHSNEDGSVSISQSSKRNRVENTANTSSVLAVDTNQAEEDDDDATMIAGQLDQNNILMSWYMAIKRRLRSANV